MQTNFMLTNTLEQCALALEQNQDVVVTRDGNWYVRNWIITIFRRILGFSDAAVSAENIHSVLSSRIFIVSTQGLSAVDDKANQVMLRLINASKKMLSSVTKTERNTYRALQQKRENLDPDKDCNSIISINHKMRCPSTAPALHSDALLSRLQIAIETLSKTQQSLEEESVNPKDHEWLLSQTYIWQERQFPYVDYLSKEAVLDKLTVCCKYKQFITAARENDILLHTFLQSIVKNMHDDSTDSVHLFMQMPHILKKLQRTALDKRLRTLAPKGIQFFQQHESPSRTPIKNVSLLIHNKYQPVTNPDATVSLGDQTVTKVRDVFEGFEMQTTSFTEFEYLQSGIEKFDGRLSQEFVASDNWWEKIPVVRRMTREEISQAYGFSFETGHSFLALRATRSSHGLVVGENHAWIDIAIPLSDGTFSILSVGKYAERFPATTCDTFYHVFRTFKGSLTVTDFNRCMPQRESTAFPLKPLTQKKFKKLMGLLTEDFSQSHKGELIFQAQGDNCASWVISLINRLYPNLNVSQASPFRVPFKHLKVPLVLKPLIWARHLFPTESLWNKFRVAICCALGASKEHILPDGLEQTRRTCLFDNPVWRKGFLELPAALFVNKEILSKRIREYSEAK